MKNSEVIEILKTAYDYARARGLDYEATKIAGTIDRLEKLEKN
jgi:hypothetical protein